LIDALIEYRQRENSCSEYFIVEFAQIKTIA